MKDKTANDNYYLLTMAALAQEIEYRRAERKGKIILAAGLPLAGFGREKTAFRQYLFRKEQPLCFRYENESYELTIEDVKLFPQGYSALALHPEYVRDEPSVLLVDIGGWTVDLMRLDNAVPNAAACRSLELGVIRCIDETMEQVRRSTGLSVTDIQIERVLNGNSCSLDPKAKEIIQKNGRSYTERILSAIMEAGFDLRAIPSVFMGGGSTIVRRHVTPQDRLCRAFYLTDVKANAAWNNEPDCGADVREVSRPVFSFRPTLDDSEHKRAWEILQSVPNGQKNAFLVQAILQSADSENLIEKIRMVFREELKGVQISPEKNMGKQEDGIPSQMLDFLSGMEENWE